MYLKNVGLLQGVLPYIEYSFFLLLNAINTFYNFLLL